MTSLFRLVISASYRRICVIKMYGAIRVCCVHIRGPGLMNSGGRVGGCEQCVDK